jgi:hypothetical protein
MGPQLRGTVISGGEQIANGATYLPAWPVEPGQMAQVNVLCRPGYETQCLPP